MQTTDWYPIYQMLADEINQQTAIKLNELLGGEIISFPIMMVRPDVVVQQIKREFKAGATKRELAHKYQKTIRTINRYLSK